MPARKKKPVSSGVRKTTRRLEESAANTKRSAQRKSKDAVIEAAQEAADMSDDVRVAQVKVLTFEVWLDSLSGLICNRLDGSVLEPNAPKLSKAKALNNCFWTDDEGFICVPSAAFTKAMVSATRSLKGNKFTMGMVKQGIDIAGPMARLYRRDGKPMKRSDSYTRKDTGRTDKGGAILVTRPCFTEWSVQLQVTINQSAVGLEETINLLNLAGFSVGVGSWRKENGGTFGRWNVRA